MGVAKLWEDIKMDYDFAEFNLHTEETGKAHLGIGVLYNAIN
tara:strand:- start:2921 stop:3046 length:126 start_codon:yes stop_codon:yes gene_type:complete